jgi:hypothetical protein
MSELAKGAWLHNTFDFGTSQVCGRLECMQDAYTIKKYIL